MIDQTIFKAYDVRGVYPDALDEDAAYAIGRAFAYKASQDNIASVVVGSDMRLSSPALKRALVDGLTQSGLAVIDVGLVPIDAVYMAVGFFGYPAGIMITASHNPKEYNGFKMMLRDLAWVRGEDLRQTVNELPSISPDQPRAAVTEMDIVPRYIEQVLSYGELSKLRPLRVVVDAGSGMAGKVIPLLQRHLPLTIVPLNFELDGNFPAHPSNPLLAESQVEIGNIIREQQADCGFIFDGDTDRVILVDELGHAVPADQTLLLLAQELLRREPGQGIVYNAICSKAVPEFIAAWGGRPIRSKVGFINVATAMRQHEGMMGGELSAHYCFRDTKFTDSGFVAWLLLLQLISEMNQPVSKLIKQFARYYKSDDISVVLTDRSRVDEIMSKLRQQYHDGIQDDLDGLTVSYSDWWFNVRPSNTEPLLRLTVEADTPELLQRQVAALRDMLMTA